ncbi:MAG: replication-associated recombination protein A [bacterium]
MNLFSENAPDDNLKAAEPLAAVMRPSTLNDFKGQKHLIGDNGIIKRMIESKNLHSLILWGPPGSGKTTLVKIIANLTETRMVEFSAVTSGVKEVKEIIKTSKFNLQAGMGRTILFIDELHRFNKAQQDAFLPHVEAGAVILFGATTENPYFSIIAPLLSRLKVYRLEQLNDDDMSMILDRAIITIEKKDEISINIDDNARSFLIDTSGGDARFIINSLEVATSFLKEKSGKEKVVITLEAAQNALLTRSLKYDKTGDEHYDTISAFIKSMRGSDPDAAIYYLARMLEAGEDPKFIARRIVIQAAEDVGNANPMALVVANAAREAVEFVGMPEAALPLAQAAIYISVSPKSNASYSAINKARMDVQKGPNPPIPLHLRNAPVKETKEKYGFSKGYQYPHEFPFGFVGDSYLPDELKNKKYYNPKKWGEEKIIREWMDALKASVQKRQKKKIESPENGDDER